jgi:hypothetical protein
MEKGVVSLKKIEQGRNGERQRELLSYLEAMRLAGRSDEDL